MRKAKVYLNGVEAGILGEITLCKDYVFEYLEDYRGLPISHTMPTNQQVYSFDSFPPFFDGLLPGGIIRILSPSILLILLLRQILVPW